MYDILEQENIALKERVKEVRVTLQRQIFDKQ
jgi:hypothetical protein